jgi:hypothetical protein
MMKIKGAKNITSRHVQYGRHPYRCQRTKALQKDYARVAKDRSLGGLFLFGMDEQCLLLAGASDVERQQKKTPHGS